MRKSVGQVSPLSDPPNRGGRSPQNRHLGQLCKYIRQRRSAEVPGRWEPTPPSAGGRKRAELGRGDSNPIGCYVPTSYVEFSCSCDRRRKGRDPM